MIQLETERLVLRMLRNEDFDDYAAMCADPEIMRFLGDRKPMNRNQAWRHMASIVGHWQLRGYGFFAVEEKATGRFVGRVGFWNPEDWPDFEIGWTTVREHWGKGYATEAARACLSYAFTNLRRDYVTSLIDPNNAASIRVAEHLGERYFQDVDLFGITVRQYRLSADEWRSANGITDDAFFSETFSVIV